MRRPASSPGVATTSRFALAAGLGALVAFISLSALVAVQDVPSWEDDVVHYITDLPGWLVFVPRVLMHISTRFTIPILALAAYGVTLRWRAAATVAAACVAGAFPVWLAKHLVSRPRPSGVPVRDDFYGSGYASGHATIAFAAAAAVAPYLLAMPHLRRDRRGPGPKHLAGGRTYPLPDHPRKLLCAVPFAMAVGVCIGRVYVGAHYPLDLVGGTLAGVAGAWLVLALPHFRPETPSSIEILPSQIQQLLYRLTSKFGHLVPAWMRTRM